MEGDKKHRTRLWIRNGTVSRNEIENYESGATLFRAMRERDIDFGTALSRARRQNRIMDLRDEMRVS